jgi:hypothetical protein
MIDKKYIFVPDMNLDLDKLKEIVFRNLNSLEPNLATHQRYVDKESYLVELRKQFNVFLYEHSGFGHI